jgi:two-component sensor histidine kinase
LRSDAAQQVTLIVRDTGMGFPGGVDAGHPETLGWQLVYSLTEQLGGRLETESHGSTTVKLTFTA